jgi:hypothetical protein
MDVLAELETSLRDRRRVIADHEWRDRDAAGHLAALKEVSEKIAELSGRLGTGAPPRLRHFLDNCSFDKALTLIERAVGLTGSGRA